MRLVAWNCCGGPVATKLCVLKALRADIAVVSESPELPQDEHTCWIGDNRRRGLAIIARPPWRVTPLDVAPVSMPKYVLPVLVSGPETFLLWGVWAHNFGRDRYVRGVHRAVDECRGVLRDRPSVLLGDFNSHSQWDHHHPKDLSHSALIGKLHDLNIVSAYHVKRDQAHGAERQPTFFEYRHRTRPYHIDYVFVPAAWSARLATVSVGRHSRWSAWSDHMPVSVDILPALTRRSSAGRARTAGGLVDRR
ncbi:MAG: endonuclease/exonuclease/phosphatase family protein [Gemmatimonadota bacterium]